MDAIDTTDWEGKPVPDNEPEDATIKVWSVPRMKTEEADLVLIRSYQRMQEYIEENLSVWLEDYTTDELMGSGAYLNIRLIEMKKCDYDALYKMLG